MNKNMKQRKGFTTVELVIVVAVIAVLATVLIPTFSGLIAKANLSADKQTVRNMNICLTTEIASDIKANKPEHFGAVKELLKAYGYGKDSNFVPKSKGYSFRWFIDDKGDNVKSNDMSVIVLVDNNNKVVFPEEYVGLNDLTNVHKYFDLSLPAAKVERDDNPNVVVDGKQLAVKYTFTANTEPSTNYSNWYADFYISIDKNVPQITLAGYYEFAGGGWRLESAPGYVGHEIALIRDALGEDNWKYKDIQTIVKVFQCGVIDVPGGEDKDATLKVELRLTNPANSADVVVLGVFEYTFK